MAWCWRSNWVVPLAALAAGGCVRSGFWSAAEPPGPPPPEIPCEPLAPVVLAEDNSPPSLSISSPAAAAQLSGTVTFEAAVDDDLLV